MVVTNLAVAATELMVSDEDPWQMTHQNRDIVTFLLWPIVNGIT